MLEIPPLKYKDVGAFVPVIALPKPQPLFTPDEFGKITIVAENGVVIGEGLLGILVKLKVKFPFVT